MNSHGYFTVHLSRFSKLQLRNEVPLNSYKIPAYLDELIQRLKLDYSSDKRSFYLLTSSHDWSTWMKGKYLTESLLLDLFRRTLLESPLSWQNYREKFQLLLHLEEQQMEVDIKRYNIPNHDIKAATMTRDPFSKKLLVLKVCSNPLIYKITQDITLLRTSEPQYRPHTIWDKASNQFLRFQYHISTHVLSQ